jgi:molecular chaperone DnaK
MQMTNILELLDTFASGARPSKPIRIVAIDLGTTNCVLTDVTWGPEDAAPVIEVLEIDQELVGGGKVTKQLVPSVVAIVDGKVLVGEGAKRFRTNKDAKFENNIWWETKNYIGTRKIYNSAPAGFKTPKEIAAKLLDFLLEAARKHNPSVIDSFIVTVPASFQLPQREDTIAAAKLAGITLEPGSLLDEPIAAFLDFLPRNMSLASTQKNTKMLVVDFGGGTCDVAALEVTLAENEGIRFARRGVSRFHRIGGGDIDRAIAYEVLLPQLLSQNNLELQNLQYSEIDRILSRLSPVAEGLKIKLSKAAMLGKSANPESDLPSDLKADLPSKVQLAFEYQGVTREFKFEAQLLLDQMLETVKPFVTDTAWVLQNEFYMSNNIFSPINDCLERSNWEDGEITDILLVGGSSMFYFYKEAVVKAFPTANVVFSEQSDQAQHSISSGAANHGLFYLLTGKPVLKSVVSQSVNLRTGNGAKGKGYLPLIPQGSTLPFPADASSASSASQDTGPVQPQISSFDELKVPKLLEDSRELTFEISSGGVSLVSKKIELDPSIKSGDPIVLDYSMDENQRLQIIARIGVGKNSQFYPLDFDNPFAVEANANAKLDQILELDYQLKAGDYVDDKDRIRMTLQLAELYSETNQIRRAIQNYKRMLDKSDSNYEKIVILYKLAGLYEELNDYSNVESAWNGAIQLGDKRALFYLADHYFDHRDDQVERAIELATQYGKSGRGMGYALAATICHKLKRVQERDGHIEDAKAQYDQNDFFDGPELYWFERAANLSGDKTWQSDISKQRASLAKRERGSNGDDNNVYPEPQK